MKRELRDYELSVEAFEIYSNSTYIFTDKLECYNLKFDRNNYITKFESLAEVEQFLLQQN